MKEICVVYLARALGGIEQIRDFLESYRHNQGGIEHDFRVVFKGFEGQGGKAIYFDLLVPFQSESFDVQDVGFDLTAYFATANHYAGQYRYFCFLNTFSSILCHDWLSKFHKHVSRTEFGMVGAAGSWQSNNPWGQILRRRRMLLNVNLSSKDKTPSLSERVKLRIIAIWRLFYTPFFFAIP